MAGWFLCLICALTVGSSILLVALDPEAPKPTEPDATPAFTCPPVGPKDQLQALSTPPEAGDHFD